MSKKKSKTKNIKVENSTETLSLSSKCNIEGVFDDDTETESITEWKADEMMLLFNNIQQLLPKNDLGKYSTTLEKGIDWNRIRLPNRDPDECKQHALKIMKQLRQHRTLTEMLEDAKKFAENPWKSQQTHRINHPDLPKKPLSTYLKYFLEKSPKLQALNPTMNMSEIAKLVAEHYAKITPKKKAHYKKIYDEEMIVYRQKLLEFKSNHPEIEFGSNGSRRFCDDQKIGPIKPRTPFQLYKDYRLKKYIEENGEEIEENEEMLKIVVDAIREAWNNTISDKKRYKFIKKSLKDQERYDQELKEFQESNPKFVAPKLKSVLTKSELELKLKYEGKPSRPPRSGYTLFSKEMLKNMSDIETNERMVKIAKIWKELPESERNRYNDEATKLGAQYLQDLNDYLKNLPEDDKERAFLEEKSYYNRKVHDIKKKAEQSFVDNTALIAYQMEELKRLQQLHPEKNTADLMNIINNEWKKMNKDQKSVYMNLAQSIKSFVPNKQVMNKLINENDTKLIKIMKTKNEKEEELFRLTGIKKPRPSGFNQVCHYILVNRHDLATRDRLRFASERWRSLSQAKRNAYNLLAKRKFQCYKEVIAKFKENGRLPTEEEKALLEKYSVSDDEINEDNDENTKDNDIDDGEDDDDDEKTEKNGIETDSSTPPTPLQTDQIQNSTVAGSKRSITEESSQKKLNTKKFKTGDGLLYEESSDETDEDDDLLSE
ncbi:myostatin [Sarcoptes scabiei]|nr:myostatin [Sarcoptes scabiei]